MSLSSFHIVLDYVGIDGTDFLVHYRYLLRGVKENKIKMEVQSNRRKALDIRMCLSPKSSTLQIPSHTSLLISSLPFDPNKLFY